MNNERVLITIGESNTERQLVNVSPAGCSSWETCTIAITFPENVSGLRILDVGGGGSDMTAKLLEDGADAYAVDPRYKSRSDLKGRVRQELDALRNTDERQYIRKYQAAFDHFWESLRQNPERYKPAFASQLPFDDNNFDFVFSIATVFGYIDMDYKLLNTATSEMIRVTKPGGKIQLYPFEERYAGQSIEAESLRLNNRERWLKWLDYHNDVTYSMSVNSRDERRVVINKLS